MARWRRLIISALLGASAFAGMLITVSVSPAMASSKQVSILEDDDQIQANPAGTLERLRALGADVVRVAMRWELIAPSPNGTHLPRDFDGSDPAAYPAANWKVWDEIVTDARRDGITVDLDLIGGAPRWALGPGRPAGNTNPNWEPSAAEFGAFVRAVATRYSGDYDPHSGTLAPGDDGDLPRVGFWSIWNEPNYGPSLAPQGVPGDLLVENSPRMYRRLLDAAWSALEATGHSPATDTVIFGELAPRGQKRWGVFSGMTPLAFLRALYCVDSGYHKLRGSAARARGCPTTAAGSSGFPARHPALFAASGVSDHPYMRWYAPNHEQSPDPTNLSSTADYSSLAVVGHLTSALDRLQRAYGSRRRLPVYDTEFGYITSPPKRSPDPGSPGKVVYVSPATAAAYMNWAEYLSWRNPRIASYAQYPLQDPERPSRSNDWGGFASGLLSWNGVPSRPTTRGRFRSTCRPLPPEPAGRSRSGGACGPPHTAEPQTAQIQFARTASGPFATIQTVTVSNPGSCYFEAKVKFRRAGRSGSATTTRRPTRC